jgi:hypothetical protein
MFVEGTLRWQVTEDCPWDLLMALCLRDLAGLEGIGAPALPRVVPEVQRVRHASGPSPVHREAVDRGALAEQWLAWWQTVVQRELRPLTSTLVPPHFTAFDRTIELQDLVLDRYEDAREWATMRRAEYAVRSTALHAQYAHDIVDVVRDREHLLRQQAGYFRLDIAVMPLAERGAWIVGPNSVVVSQSLRDDRSAFRSWFAPLVAALV